MMNIDFGGVRNSAVASQPCSNESHNTGYTAHFVRPNRLSPTSYSPIPLCIIGRLR